MEGKREEGEVRVTEWSDRKLDVDYTSNELARSQNQAASTRETSAVYPPPPPPHPGPVLLSPTPAVSTAGDELLRPPP